MLRYLLDTNLCVRALRNRPTSIRERLTTEAEGLATSTIVLYELYLGAELSSRPDENRAQVEEFVARLELLEFDAVAAAHAADIRAHLQRNGNLIGYHDILIAGHARSRGLTVLTGNLGEFARVEGLRCEDWL